MANENRAELLDGYLADGMTPQEAILKLKAEHPQLTKIRHYNRGVPQTFEGLVHFFVKNLGMTGADAVAKAEKQDPRKFREYLDRFSDGMAAGLDYVRQGRYPG